jgi:hypothetical protein
VAIVILVALTLSSALAWSQVEQGFLAVSEIRPGMKGYGLTVFRGTTPERFDVEVIDVLHKFRPDQDLVLIRTQHPILDRAITVAGMSGSPIYLNGKLIGAYAYGWTFGKEPIAGVTPIANMMAEMGRPIDPAIWKALGTLPVQTAQLTAAHERDTALAALRAHAARQRLESEDTAWGRPLPAATPLQVSGLGDAGTALLAHTFKPFGLVPVQAGSGAAPARKTPSSEHFVDGGSIGVQLVRGDINVTAVGTVTHVVGRKLVAFGHPMMNAGQVGLATCTARVVHILSSEMRSFKLAEPVAPLGALIQDRQAAIVVDEQMRADMIPLRVRILGVTGAPRSEWNMEVASHHLLTPGLVLTTISNAIEATASDRTDAVLQVESHIAIDHHAPQHVSEVLVTNNGATDAATLGRLRVFNLLNTAYANPFEQARVSRIDIDLHVTFARDLVTIVDAQLPSDTVDPGKPVTLAVTLRRFDQSEHVKLVPLMIPQSAAGDSLEITVEAGDDVAVERPKPSSLDDLLAAVQPGYSGTSLVVSTKLQEQGVKLRGQLVRSLPGSALDTLQPSNEADRGALFPTYERKELPLGRAVTGSAKLKLNVRAEAIR